MGPDFGGYCWPVLCVCFFLTGVVTGRLEEVVRNEDILKIATDHLTDWESLRPYLGLNRLQKKDIRMTYPGDYTMQKYSCLQEWKDMHGKEATYGALITAAESATHQHLVDGVRAMLTEDHFSRRSE